MLAYDENFNNCAKSIQKGPTVLNDHNNKMTWDDIFCLLLILFLYIYYYEKIENAIERLF